MTDMTKSMWRVSMNIKPIRNDDDLRAAFQRLELVFQAQAGTPEEDEMEILVTLIEAYEHKHFPTGPADPVDAIKFRLEQQGRMTDCTSPTRAFWQQHRVHESN